MANNKNPKSKATRRKESWEFHYNPGNMARKIIGNKDKSEHQGDADKVNRRRGQEDQAPRRSKPYFPHAIPAAKNTDWLGTAMSQTRLPKHMAGQRDLRSHKRGFARR
jgi:hypothetical protein